VKKLSCKIGQGKGHVIMTAKYINTICHAISQKFVRTRVVQICSCPVKLKN
jgi:hypothetical protein